MSSNHALIIGVNQYPNLDPRYNLAGCVADAQLMKSVVMNRFGFQSDDIYELYDLDASQANIQNAMQDLLNKCEENDCVFFHFAGHGSQRTCEDGTEASGFDSTIMPSDSGRGDFPNLDISDDEIGDWLEKLTAKTDNITMIFDCCHSGTITRDASLSASRGIPVDERSHQEMGLTEKKSGTAKRSTSGGSFLARSERYVVMSGCRDDELANEYSQEKNGTVLRHGALTYWLSQKMLEAKPTTTYQDVFQQASQQISTLFPTQHPQIEGRRDRVLFGTEHVESMKYFTIQSVENTVVSIDGGAAHGVENGSEWAVYPAGTNSTTDIQAIAKISITTVNAMTSQASIEAPCADVVPGCRCVLLSSPVSIPSLSLDIQSLSEKTQLTLSERIEASELLQTAQESQAADLHMFEANGLVRVLAKDEFAVLPQQKLDTEDDFTRIISNLETYAKARNVFNLSNPDSQLNIDFNVFRSRDGRDWQKIDENTVFIHGDQVAFEVTNNEHRDVFFSVLDIGLTSRVALFYPPGQNSEKIAAGKTLRVGFERIKIQLGVPADFEHPVGRETFKAMISTDQTSFSWLQQAGTRSLEASQPSTLLQKLMQQAMQGSKTRDPVISWAEPEDDWLSINRSFELRKS